MQWMTDLPRPLGLSGHVMILEASAGESRRRRLEEWLQQSRDEGAATWFLSCDREKGGPWAGLADWLYTLLPQVQAEAPDLLTQHDYELCYVLPAIRRTLDVRNPTLTDISPDRERVRNYPVDRAYRIGHGLVNFLDRWRSRSSSTNPWVVVCDSFDRSGVLVQRLLRDLMRRRGQSLRLTLVLAVEPGAGATIAERFGLHSGLSGARLDLPPDPPVPVHGDEMTRLAQALEEQIGTDQIELELHLPRLLQSWRLSDHPENGLRWFSSAFSLYTTRGMYEDALPYGHEALALLNRYEPDNLVKRWAIVGKLHSCYTGLNRAQEATPMLEELIEMTDDPSLRFRGSSMMGILHARYLPERDLAKADMWLERGMAEIQQSNLPEQERIFFSVFNRNGLALVRQRQGRPEEAIELCRAGFELLDQHLNPGDHRLHRSVLLYNIAQVYAAMGHFEDAIRFITSAMAMDPNYSEYYNDRGNWKMHLGWAEEAYADYVEAIKLSPPYPEVLANLARCGARLGRMSEAIAAYSECLDLTPEDALARVGRAQVHEALGQTVEALADYSAVLALRPDFVEVRANRATLCYELGQVNEALAELDQAIALAPATGDLYYNRATALKDLERYQEAARDLRTYLDLTGDVQDRMDVEAEITALTAAAAS